MLQSTASDKWSRCFRALADSGHCSGAVLFTPFAYKFGLISWKPEHMLTRNAVPPHFRSDGGVGLHNVAGQGNVTKHAADTSTLDVHVRGGASKHALAVGDMRFHRCGASLRRQKLLSNCPCDHHSVPCSVRLARATSRFTPQLYMQIPLGDLRANAISLPDHT